MNDMTSTPSLFQAISALSDNKFTFMAAVTAVAIIVTALFFYSLIDRWINHCEWKLKAQNEHEEKMAELGVTEVEEEDIDPNVLLEEDSKSKTDEQTTTE